MDDILNYLQELQKKIFETKKNRQSELFKQKNDSHHKHGNKGIKRKVFLRIIL
jgi:hypothetical protein